MEFLEACKSSFGTFGTFVFRLVKWFESINYKHLIVCSAYVLGPVFAILRFVSGASWERAVCMCGVQKGIYTSGDVK